MRICVTKEDINRGIKGNVDLCPIALAVGRAFHASAWCGINMAGVRDQGTGERRFRLPAIARDFVHMFDCGPRGLEWQPFDFELDDSDASPSA